MNKIDKINLIGEKWVDGKLTVEVAQVNEVDFPHTKMKEFVRSYFGGSASFGDEDDYCDASMAYAAMLDFHSWYMNQQQLIKEQNEY